MHDAGPVKSVELGVRKAVADALGQVDALTFHHDHKVFVFVGVDIFKHRQGVAVGNAVVRVTLLVVAPAAIVPTKPNEGTKPIVAPTPNVPARAGDCTKFQAFVTKLKRLRTVADAN